MGSDVIKLPGLPRQESCRVLYSLQLLQQTVIHTSTEDSRQRQTVTLGTDPNAHYSSQ